MDNGVLLPTIDRSLLPGDVVDRCLSGGYQLGWLFKKMRSHTPSSAPAERFHSPFYVSIDGVDVDAATCRWAHTGRTPIQLMCAMTVSLTRRGE